MDRKGFLDHKIVFAMFLVVVIIAAIFGLSFFKEYVGYAGYAMNASAGYITEITIHHEFSPRYWAGLYREFYSI